MSIFEIITAAFRGIRGMLTRSILTAIMIAMGVGAVITLTAIGAGAAKFTTDLVAQHFPMSASFALTETTDQSVAPLTLDDAAAIASSGRTTKVTSIVPEVTDSVKITSGVETVTATIVGTTADYFPLNRKAVMQGRLLNSNDIESAASVAVINSSLQEKLFTDGQALGKSIIVGNASLVVVGVTVPTQEYTETLYAPIKRVMSSIAPSQPLERISVGAASMEQVEVAATQAKAVLTARRAVPVSASIFTILTPKSTLEFAEQSQRAQTDLMTGISIVSLTMAGIGVTNVMLLNVRERTREIGIRKALGARSGSIAGQFMAEATVLSICGGIAGILLAFVVVQFPIAVYPPLLEPSTIVFAAGLSAGIGIVFGTLPAIRASRLNPVQALRTGV